jgi:hypothetical protein
MSANVVRLLDAAGDAAWQSWGRDRAILAALAVLQSGTPAEAAAAVAAWCRAVDFVGDVSEPGLFLTFIADRYRDRGDIALSLKRAAVMTELAAA